MIFSRRDIVEGIKPDWYLGLSYHDFYLDVAYYYPIPLNFIVRYAKTIQIFWDKFRNRPSWIDYQIKAVLIKELIETKEAKKCQK